MATLQQILQCPNNYEQIIQELVAKQDFKTLKDALFQLSQDEQKVLYTKKFFNSLTKFYQKIKSPEMKALGESIVEGFQNKGFFDLEVYLTKVELSQVYEAEKQYYLAARILTDVNYESSVLNLDKAKRAYRYLKIIDNYFEVEEVNQADIWIKKCGEIDFEELKDKTLNQMYELAFARYQDFSRRFLPAAVKYYNLSIISNNEQIVLFALNSAIVCAILGAAGPQRSRILSNLYKDERTKNLENFDMLQKTFMERIITKEDKDKFSKGLKAHQKAIAEEDYTVVDKAIIEHNIQAASKVYETINIKSLSQILQISEDKTEQILQKMIEEQRLQAQMDQLTNFITFLQDEQIPTDFNERISNFCGKVNDFLDKVTKLN